MKSKVKKLLSLFFCLALVISILPMISHDAHAAPHQVFSNTAGCRTHVWCNWGCHSYDTYAHAYNAAGYCVYCGAFGGHTHSFVRSGPAAGHPHTISMTCACGYGYAYYASDPGCVACYPCTVHSMVLSGVSNNGNGTHVVRSYCTRCLATSNSTVSCSTSYSGVTATGGGTHNLNYSCVCGYTTSSAQACSGGKATVSAPANCIVCGQPYGSPDPCANGHNFYAYYCDAEHPHANYNYCLNCRYKAYDGTTRYKSNCSICNPSLVCNHTAEWFTEGAHPHRVYCRGCCKLMKESSTMEGCSQCGSGSSSVSIWAETYDSEGKVLTHCENAGILSIEYAKTISDRFTYGANITGSSDTLKSITCTGLSTGSGGVVNLTNYTLGTYTITATTTKGATRTAIFTVKTQSAAIGDIRYKTIQMNVTDISGNSLTKRTNFNISLIDASTISESSFNTIADQIPNKDGKVYTVTGPLIVEVYNIKTNKIYGRYNVLTERSGLDAYGWGQSTLADFQTMQSVSIAYNAPKQINATAVYCSQDRATVFGTVTAQSLGAPNYVYPYETKTVTFTNGAVSPAAADWEYQGLQWIYSPNDAAHASGSQVGQTSITETFTSTSPAATYYFYWKAKPKTGSITVSAVDAATGAGIPGASVSCGGQSGSSGATFSNLPFGTYSASASAPGYYSGSGSAAISATALNASIVIPLQRIPTHGNLTVTVKNSVTGAVIPNANVSCAGLNQVTNASGSTTFSNVLAGSYAVTASAGSEYDPKTVNAQIDAGTTRYVTIYLDPSINVSITPAVNGSGTYRKGSAVIAAATFTADRNILPSNPATVSFLATYKKASGSGYVTTTIISQSKPVIVPAGETNLVWFELTLPAGGYYSDSIDLEFTISPPPGTSGTTDTSVTSADVVSPVVRTSPQTKFEKGAPPSFLRLNRKSRTSPSLSWSIWEWSGGGFVRNTYNASLNSTASLSPDETAGYKSVNSGTGMWTTRSGYGINTTLTVSVPNLDGMIAGTAKADVFYPEYNYTTSSVYSDNLLFGSSATSGGNIGYCLTFPVDINGISKNKMHKTPVWFPDGEYTVNYSIFDVWTPAGELTATNYATIIIDGNMYDDSYVKPLKPNN